MMNKETIYDRKTLEDILQVAYKKMNSDVERYWEYIDNKDNTSTLTEAKTAVQKILQQIELAEQLEIAVKPTVDEIEEIFNEVIRIYTVERERTFRIVRTKSEYLNVWERHIPESHEIGEERGKENLALSFVRYTQNTGQLQTYRGYKTIGDDTKNRLRKLKEKKMKEQLGVE